MKTKRTNLDIEECHRLFTYDPTVGALMHKQGSRKGKKAGWANKKRYINVTVNNRNWLAHVVILAMRDGFVDPRVIDHINHDEADNRYENLRHVSHRENTLNRRPGAIVGKPYPSPRTIIEDLQGFQRITDTQCSLRGARYSRSTRAWRAAISNRGSQVMLGSFKSSYDAVSAYDAAAVKILNGTF